MNPRILHLFANFKWTGPADPAIRCAASLRHAGADVRFAQADWTLPDAEHRMAMELRRARMPVLTGLELRKHFHVPSLLRDVRALRSRLASRGSLGVLHAHLLADHLIAAIAKRRTRRPPVLVRSYYEPVAPSRTSWRDRLTLRYTDGVVVPGTTVREQIVDRFGFDASRVLVQDPPIAPPSRVDPAAVREQRRRLGFTDEEFVIGITARIQPHRRFDLLWQSLRALVDQRPRVRLVLLGRGNARDTERLVQAPVRELGLDPYVALPGYLYEPEYGLTLRALDAFMFLVPGSDGTCRAVREAMAVGLPTVATRRGILPELLGPRGDASGACGLLCDESPAEFAQAFVSLVDDPSHRRGLGDAALARVQRSMDPGRAARRLLDFYAKLAERAR